MKKKDVLIFLEDHEIAAVDAYARELEAQQQKEDEKLPPTRRRRSVSRSKAIRTLILERLDWLGFTPEEDKPTT